MGFLRNIPQDCTFNQGAFTSRPHCGPYYSIDLSSATDRMPIALQRRVIGRIIGDDRATAWSDLLVGSEYAVTDAKGKTSFVSYNTGQPMGAYSSWPAMALTHHVIVRYAALLVGKSRFSNYFLLGDDLVISDRQVAESYRRVLCTLDMPVSEPKTIVSERLFEFAKRWFLDGSEITPYATAGLSSVAKRYSMLCNFLNTQASHGWHLQDSKIGGLVHAVHKSL